MEMMRQDIRFALRGLRKRPGFAAIAVLTLALGIGAATCIFSVVYGVLLRPLPYPEPDQLVRVWQISADGDRTDLSDPNFRDLRAASRSFQALAEVGKVGISSVVGGSSPARAATAAVSREFFAVLGVEPILGRAFIPQEQRPGGTPAVVVSHDFWSRYLGGAPGLAGRSLTFGGRVHSVVGVMPPGFDFPAGTDLWTPRELWPRERSRTAHNWPTYGRLDDGVTLERARRELSGIARRLRARYGDDTWMVDAAVVSLHEQTVGNVRPALLILLGAAGFLLLVAGANVANLLLARASTRRREVAIRTALGASRRRLIRRFLAEPLILSLVGGLLGVLLTIWGLNVLHAIEPDGVPRLDAIAVTAPVLLFAIALSVFVAVAIGLATALRETARSPREALVAARGTAADGGASGRRLRSALVASQVALTLVLLVGAGLLGRSFVRLLAVDPGFRTDDVVVMSVSLPSPRNQGEKDRLVGVHRDLLARLRALPGIQRAGGVNRLPFAGAGGSGIFLVLNRPDEVSSFADFGRLADDPARTGYADFRVASQGYFRAMGIPLVRGRLFDTRDAPHARHVAVISRSLADDRWPDEDPIGKLVQFGNMDGDLRPITIVGVVGDVRERGLDAERRPTFYVNYRQRPGSAYRFSYVLYGTADPASTIASARDILRSRVPDAPPSFRTLDALLASSLAERRFSLLLLGIFGGTALLLAVLGIYGAIAYSVSQRTREIGIRIALGARASAVSWSVVRGGARLAALGILIGVPTAFALTRLLRAMLFGIEPTDPLTFIAVGLLLAAVAAAASYQPARRAASVDPMEILRMD